MVARLENGNHLAINTWEYSKIDHAYATTLHKSQGKTYDNTILLASKRGVMDAEATYVGMTRHRNNVDVYYSKSDFGSFKELANSVSKYSHKDLLADYKPTENLNKGEHCPRARVLEYQNLRSEIVTLIDDSKSGAIANKVSETAWKELNELNVRKVETEKKILGNYKSHKLYLDQLGITKEKLEISAGIKQRPITRAELEAKNTVVEYAKIAQETRATYESIKKESFNITKHKDYEKYCEIREIRNNFAEKILSNKTLYKEFVNEMSREYFISFKGMEKQINYGTSLKTENSKIAGTITEKIPRITVTSKSENDIFAKIESAKNDSVRKNEYKGATLANRLQFNKSREGYSTIKSIHIKHFGYEPHISRAMVYSYGGEHNIPEKLYKGNLTYEYASMLVENKLKSAGETEITLDIVKESIKHAICFQALKQAADAKELTPQIAADLHAKSAVLSLHLTKDNMHVLKNKELMREVCTAIQGQPEKDTQQVDSMNFDRLIKLDQKDLLREENNKDLELDRNMEMSKGFEINHL